MTYKNESGAIIDSNRNIIYFVQGTSGSVEFPSEFIITLHKEHPNSIYALAHTHPPGFITLSSLDEALLRNWTKVFHPFPARLSVISELEGNSREWIAFRHTMYRGQLESMEQWIARKKETPRIVTIEKEWSDDFHYYEDSSYRMENFLIQHSYIDLPILKIQNLSQSKNAS